LDHWHAKTAEQWNHGPNDSDHGSVNVLRELLDGVLVGMSKVNDFIVVHRMVLAMHDRVLHFLNVNRRRPLELFAWSDGFVD